MAESLAKLLDQHALLVAAGLHDGGDTIWLIAPDTRRFWEHLSTQPEAQDGEPDRVDRWSARVLPQIATACDAQAILPFGGPPWHPFLRWATESGTIWQSPVGPLIDAQMGMWISFRGALRQRGHHQLPDSAETPCPTCTKPCQSACPIGALGDGPYDVAACRRHIASPDGIACRSGCLVRHACPVGREFALPPAHGAHHMAAFLGQQP